jgi:biopolymer transport protein ExbD
MQFPRKRRRNPVLNIIPLIDVLVVLLIFYIATTVYKKPQPQINIVVPP